MALKKPKEEAIQIQEIKVGRVGFRLVGTAPMIMHRFSAKAWRELLYPSSKAKKNSAAKEASLKHDPLTEYRECLYINRDPKEPTFVHFPARAFAQAMAAAALDLPGASKSAIQRLVSVSSLQVNVWGTPMLGMDMVRSSDMARTPDVRTRAYFPEWCCEIEVSYIKSLIGQAEVFNLLAAAGCITGIGDYRIQKGGSFGSFEIVETDDKRFTAIQKQDRKVQEAAWATPDFYTPESAELYGWFVDELERREKTAPSSGIFEPALQPVSPVIADLKNKGAGRSRANGKHARA